MNPHREILGEVQATVLAEHAPIAAAAGFHLGGGTAVALHLGHRRSEDFDWFGGTRLDDPHAFARELIDGGLSWRTEEVAPGTLHGSIRGVKVSFFAYRYEPLAAPEVADGLGFRVASLDDLAAMKLSAIVQRGALRDFVDVHALVRARGSLRILIDSYLAKFQVESPAHVLYGLSYFDDADTERMPTMLDPTDRETIKKDIRQWVKEYSSR